MVRGFSQNRQVERQLETMLTQQRLGDDLDDYCIKCKRVTNHVIVALIDAKPAKVRCRTCYHDHEFLHEQAPPSKKDLLKKNGATPPA